ncbi:hypothetical protein [Pseudomonas sp. OTU750018]|uniref:hypothetical protein n=1 Tax=Pseudomonas sp. OTU750018 TaxID=2709708 RepID=UPI001421C6ED|nr:hypothetical protein [Pseudomonas sp. OTU750018]
MTGERATRFLAVFALISGCGFLLLNPLRLAFIANTLIPFLYFNLIVMLCCGALFLLKVRTLEVRPVEFLLCLLIFATAVTTNYDGRYIVDVMTDFLRPILFIFIVVVFRNFVNVESFNASRSLRGWIRLSMWVTVIIVPVSWVITLFILPLYPAYSSMDSIFGMGWLLATGNFFLQAAYLMVLVASGKRGVYLAALVVIFLYYRNLKFSLASWLGVFIIAFFAFVLLVLYGEEVQKVFLKGASSDASESISGFIDVLSGGRLDEFQGAIAGMASPLQFIFGAGLGFAYEAKGFADAAEGHRNLHFTPASLAIYYGIPFTIVFFYYLATIFSTALRMTRDYTNVVVFCYAVYCMASMFFLLTEFSVFAYVNFAISCGVVAAAAKAERRFQHARNKSIA